MQENTNRAILYNSVILYIKMAVSIVTGLLAARFTLQALGIVDYGLYAVLGGIISFIGIFNTIMLSSSNRFIAVALGKGNMEEVNKQFNVNFIIHLAIAIGSLVVAVPLGEWYIPRYVNYDGPLSNAMMVYFVSVVGSIISFVGVPYNGLLMAKEKFIVFSLVEIIIHIIRLVIAWLLVNHFEQKLFIYTVSAAVLTAVSTAIYIIYCSRHYSQIVHLRRVRDKKMYKSVFGFSSWVAVGAVATVGKNQGAALIVNAFFNTVMNTAMGVATSITSYVSMFANNVIQPVQPQITKSYAAGDTKRTDELLVMSTKYSYLLVLLLGSVFLIEPEWLINVWLGNVPPYADVFLKLFIIDTLIISLNAGVSNIIWANGKIWLYQVVVSVLNLMAVIIGYLVLKLGAEAYYMFVVFIGISIIRFFAIQWALHRVLDYDNRKLWVHSYIPSVVVTCLFLPILFIPIPLHPVVKLIISLIYLSLLIWFLGLTKDERYRMVMFVKRRIHK